VSKCEVWRSKVKITGNENVKWASESRSWTTASWIRACKRTGNMRGECARVAKMRKLEKNDVREKEKWRCCPEVEVNRRCVVCMICWMLNDDNQWYIGIVPCKSGYSASFGVSSTGGATHLSVTDLTQCQLVCSLAVSCVGLDYDRGSNPPLCVTHDNSTFDSRRTTSGTSRSTVQYTKVDACATSKAVLGTFRLQCWIYQ